MLFPGTVAGKAAEVTLKAETGTFFAFHWPVGSVFLVVVLAFARRTPFVDVEVFAPRQPMHANLLRTPWNELELLALTLIARMILVIVSRQQVATETLRV